MLLSAVFAFALAASSTGTAAAPARLTFVRAAGDTAPIFATVNGVDILRAPVEAALAARLAVVRQTDPSATALRPSDRRAVVLTFVEAVLWQGYHPTDEPHGVCVLAASSPTCVATPGIAAASGRGVDLAVLRADAQERAKAPRESLVCTMATGAEATVAQANAWRALSSSRREAVIANLMATEGTCYSTANFNDLRTRDAALEALLVKLDAAAPHSVVGPVDSAGTPTIFYVSYHLDLAAGSIDDYRFVARLTAPQFQVALAGASPQRRLLLSMANADKQTAEGMLQMALHDLIRAAKVTLVDAPMTWEALQTAPD